MKLVKALTAGDPGLFNYNLTGATSLTNSAGSGDKLQVASVTANTTVNFGESAGTGTTLSNYALGASCTRGDGQTVSVSGAAGQYSFSMPSGAAVVCTLTNTRYTANLTLIKNVVNRQAGTALPADFTLLATGPQQLTGNGTAAGNVYTGQYTLTESSSPAISVQYAAGSWSCTGATLNGNTLDLTTPNASATCTITNTHREADLQVTKTAAAPAVPGKSLQWTVIVTNAGPDLVTGATIADTLPAGSTWSALASGGATGFTASGSGSINGTVTMPVGSTITYTVTTPIDPAATGTLSNTATVTPPSGGPDDPVPGNNTATATVNLAPSADLKITKSQASPNPAIPGQPLTWTMTVENLGPSTAVGVTSADTVPSSVTGLTFTSSSGSCSGSAMVTCALGNMAPNATVTYTITGTLTDTFTGNLVNTATVTSNTSDPDLNNNSSTSTTPTNPSSLVIAKTNNLTEVVKGANVTYTVTIKNTGGGAATGVAWTDTPTGLTINSISGGNGTCSPTGCTGVTVAGGATITFTVNATVTGHAGTQAKNLVSMTGGSTCTAQQSCTAEDVDPIVAPLLGVTKSSPMIANASGNQWTATYTVTVANTGTASGTYTLNDTPGFPSGVTLNSWAVTASGGGTVNPALPSTPSGQISGSGLAIDKGVTHTYSVVITFTTSAAATALTCNAATANGAFNTATISGSTAASVNACGNLPAPLNLTLAKKSSVTQAAVNDSFTYTFTASNSGPVATTDPTTVVDTIPAGVTVTEVTAGAGFTCTPSAALPLAGDGSTTKVTCTSTGVAAGAQNVLVAALTVKKTTTATVTNSVVATTGDPRCTGSANPCSASVVVTDNTPPTPEPPPVVNVPTTSPEGLIALALMMLGMAGWASRRGRRGR